MSNGILRVKISIPPIGSGILERNLGRDDPFTRPLTLVSAPAGYGKTTQVRTWLAGRESTAAWYSLDEADDDPRRFWSHLIEALQVPAPGTGIVSRGMLESADPGPGPALERGSSPGAGSYLVPLLNDLFSLERPVYLVLDDYHHVEHAAVQRDMEFFLENLPPLVRVVVTTRSDPPWPLARWRVRDVMTEVRLEELRFSAHEAGQLCERRAGVTLAEDHLAILTEKTEGWIAGLQLAVHSLDSHREDLDRFLREFDGSHRHVLHFLSEEIFTRQSREMRDFLMKSSVLQRFCAPLCDAVTGRDDSEELINELVRANLFILRLDEQGVWLRYHALFSDLLRHRLMREDPHEVPDLHRRAARWFLSREMPGEAVRHALLAHDTTTSIRILEQYHDVILTTDGPVQLMRCLEELPHHELCTSPMLVLYKALYLLNYFGRERAEPYLRLAESLSYESPAEQQRFLGMRSTVFAFCSIYSHEPDRAIDHAREALRLLPREDWTWRMRVAIYSGDARLFSGNPREAYPCYEEAHWNALKGTNRFFPLTTGIKKAITLHYLGRLHEAREMTHEMLAMARREGLARIPRVALHWGLLGELHREAGNLEEAERCLERALLIGAEEKPAWGWNALYLAALYHSRGKPSRVLETIGRIETLNRELALPRFVTIGATIRKARTLVSLGRDGDARQELASLGVEEGGPLAPGMERAGLVLARIMNGEAAHVLLDLLEERARAGGDLPVLVETLLLKERNPHGQAPVETARAVGERAGFYQIFLDEGDGADTGAGTDRGAGTDTGAGTGPDAVPTDSKGTRARTSSIGLVEDLSEREMDVLRLVGAGLSNDEIGEKLFISPGTVKWHLSNVFGKLGVSKRTRAVVVAREMGLSV